MIDIDDLEIGDTITNGVVEQEVIGIDKANGDLAVKDKHGQTVSFDLSVWNAYGYSKKLVPQTPGPSLAQQAISAQAQQAVLNGWLGQLLPPVPGWLGQLLPPAVPPPVIQATVSIGKPKNTRKQVSHNGKDWCDYRLLLDADPFESYEHRREI